MPKFSYTIRDHNGKTFKDVMEGFDRNAVVLQLQKQNYFVVSVTEIRSGSRAKGKNQKKKKKKFSHKKVKLADMVAFARQLGTMLEAGVTLIRSLDVILTQVQSQQFNTALRQIRNDVEKGESLSSCLAKHPLVFNQFWVSLVEVGEASGTIPTVLAKLNFYLEQQARFRSTIISGIIYPAILFCVSCGAVVFFALVVGPKFEEIFVSMGAQLPMITVVLLAIFKFIKQQFLLLIAAIVGAVWLLKKFIATPLGRLKFERFLFSMPTFGEVYRLIIVERFTSQMAILIDAGVPILYALDISERLVDNATCANIISDIRESVKSGELLVAPMERSEFFPPMATQMIMVGEETGELSKMLKHVSAFYQDAVETFMQRFATIVEPFMLVFMGGVIGTIVLAMFLPMFNLSQLG
ncbi:MAG: type II secretion system F family protein [Candidatus Omnitrophica bacterium]|nr:type II secretion system F family protein [Candidatus Omnitrophota bacterium]MCB9721802.1 type II secretion system F family protein [Candidatus Omnitrophota bacterium]